MSSAEQEIVDLSIDDVKVVLEFDSYKGWTEVFNELIKLNPLV